MKVSLTTSLLLCSVVALALPTDVTSQPIDPETGLLLPHYYDEIDLDDYEAWEKAGGNDTDFEPLVKRTQIAVCSYTTHHGDCMTFLGSGLESVSRQIAVRFYDASKNDNCDHFTGASASFNWDQHATNKDPSSNACGTTANVGTINGAIQNYFRSTGSGSCGVKCLQLSHGDGTWRGYVSFAQDRYTASLYGCGPHSANVCYSGGEKYCEGADCGVSP